MLTDRLVLVYIMPSRPHRTGFKDINDQYLVVICIVNKHSLVEIHCQGLMEGGFTLDWNEACSLETENKAK